MVTSPDDAREITLLLNRMAAGDAAASEALLPRLYAQFHELAERMMRDDRRVTLQPTALVHEAWMRLTGGAFENREHFAAVAARAMRSVLVDHARRRAADKRGGGHARVPLDEVSALFQENVPDLLALDEALRRLDQQDPELGRIVELRFFGGLSVEETARVLGSSTATVTRGWRVARMWLVRELDGPRS
jgi:RNA polymerase sigma-70 factor, ECF subfamily